MSIIIWVNTEHLEKYKMTIYYLWWFYGAQIEKYKLLGLNVAYYRRRRELTQEQLAEMVDVERTHIGNLELARNGVSLDVVFRVADALEIPVHKLFEFRD